MVILNYIFILNIFRISYDIALQIDSNDLLYAWYYKGNALNS